MVSGSGAYAMMGRTVTGIVVSKKLGQFGLIEFSSGQGWDVHV